MVISKELKDRCIFVPYGSFVKFSDHVKMDGLKIHRAPEGEYWEPIYLQKVDPLGDKSFDELLAWSQRVREAGFATIEPMELDPNYIPARIDSVSVDRKYYEALVELRAAVFSATFKDSK